LDEQQEEGLKLRSEVDGTRPSDGSIDFSTYSLAQLEELRHSIDEQLYPKNFANLLTELERQRTRADREPSQAVEIGRFTARDGTRGWFQAKRRRLPVYGYGGLQFREENVVLQGWQRTWLGVPYRSSIVIPARQIRNVEHDQDRVRFEWQQPRRLARPVEFRPDARENVATIVAQLPDTRSAGFRKQWTEFEEFQRRLSTVNPRSWFTPMLVLANLGVYVAMAVASRRPGGFPLQQLISWGANYGPLTVGGQWWRLVAATFVHVNLVHVGLNMWALWNAGRLTERLYGKWSYLFLYFASGVLASFASIAWDPRQVSMGASGAIFGVLGAFLAFLARRRADVPAAMLRAHWISTLAFVLFNLVSGFLQPGIDNAAHVGGILSGFFLGWLLARPLNPDERSEFPFKPSLAALMFASAAVLAALWQVQGLASQLAPNERYIRDHAWYMKGETTNLQLWQDLAAQAAAGTISDAELGERFARDILPFWQSAEARLRKEAPSVHAAQRKTADLLLQYVQARLEWCRAVIDATRNQDASRIRDAQQLSAKTTLIQARLERIALRASMDHWAHALTNSPMVVALRSALSGRRWKCVPAPAILGPHVAPTDAYTDGPAARAAMGCRAQRLFMARDYASLESLIDRYSASLTDLPDGGSTLSAIFGGLGDLFEYGNLNLDQTLGRTADWRRAMPGSLLPDLLEAQIFDDWAWTARGTGSATQVSKQAWALFAYRAEMAAAALDDTNALAGTDPEWFNLSLSVGLDRSLPLEALRATFDEGQSKFPRYWPLYRSMLRILMPRWLGSYQKVDAFIGEMSLADYATYARLYWMYDSLEGDDIDIFKNASAEWMEMQIGFEDLRRLYPRSDFILNGYARFACIAGDKSRYGALRPHLKGHLSATAWTAKVSVESCDAKQVR
jgi:membrane associated rhomboid family serine protease